MPGIAIFSGMHCGADKIVDDLFANSGFRLLTDPQLIEKAAEASGMPDEKIRRALSARTSVFNPFTHEKEFCIASLRLVLAKELKEGSLLVHGYCGVLIPRSIRDIYRVCITASTPYRLECAQTVSSLDEQEAVEQIRAGDADVAAWTEFLYGITNPWDKCLYDMVLSMDQTDRAAAVSQIETHLGEVTGESNDAAIRALDDFELSAMVETALYRAGHDVSVSAEGRNVVLTIRKQVLVQAQLEEELCDLAENVTGVQSVIVRVEDQSQSSQVYHRYTRKHPSRVLLVDDEKEFVRTLSERLQLRGIGSAVSFDGETALALVKEDPPEVMVLDLKMPRVDGMAVLAAVKETWPAIEVIVLTGHGNESDRKRCMEKGAFAYMQKPVDMEILSDAIRKAHEKIYNPSP